MSTTLATAPARQCLRDDLTTIIPDKMRKRPLDARGYPVPWFVQWYDGKPDFRIMDPRKYQLALDKRRCWLCGASIGKYATFVVGLMSIVERLSTEPPSHIECAKFAVRGCPYLTIPTAQRREHNLPATTVVTPGVLPDNPQVSVLWTTSHWQPITVMGDNGPCVVVLFGDAKHVTFWREGKPASPADVWATWWARMPLLQARADQDGGHAPRELAARVDAAMFYLPDNT